MRIIFFGTSPFALPALHALVDSPEHDIIAVVTQPDRPQGRGGKLAASPVKLAALSFELPVLQPEKVRAKDFVEYIKSLAPDVCVVAAFGQIISQRLLDIPSYGCINIHGSLLPRWRGAAPMQYALMSGDKETGVTTMMMDAGLDTGDILLQSTLPLTESDNLGTLEQNLSALGGPLLLETLSKLQAGYCPSTPQEPDLVTLAPSLPPDIGELDWSKPAEVLHNLVRGVTPRPGAYTYWNGKRLKIWRTSPLPQPDGIAGMVQNIGDGGITVGSGDGSLRLIEVQPESKGKMAADAWARGARIATGMSFGRDIVG